MIKLIITPNFKNFKENEFEFGHYLLILPQNETIVCEMKCTTMRWALWDTDLYLKPYLDKYFGKENWITEFKEFSMPVERKVYLKMINNSNDQINLDSYSSQRQGDTLPPWSDEPDKYQYKIAV